MNNLCFEKYINKNILAVDVGGTNISCAIMKCSANSFEKILEQHFETKKQTSLIEPLKKFYLEIKNNNISLPIFAGISAAGPLENNKIILTNADWDVDGTEIEKEFNIKTFVVNDFCAIAWGILLLDKDNPEELICLSKNVSANKKAPIVILGAGTGLGLACIYCDEKIPRVCPTEGGHSLLPVFDNFSRGFSEWLEKKFNSPTDTEDAVSGQGISNIFNYLCSTMQDTITDKETINCILARPETEQPALISKSAIQGNSICKLTMELFVKFYARAANSCASLFFPYGGIYLAGGIAAKNLKFFTDNELFINSFIESRRIHIKKIAEKCPVFVVKNYDISLYGVANAAINLSLGLEEV